MNELEVKLEKTFFDEFFTSETVLKNYTFNQEIRNQANFLRNDQPNTKIADILIQKSDNKIEFTLNSGSFLEVASYVGGIWSISFLILSQIIKSYNKNEFNIDIGNKLFTFKSKNHNNYEQKPNENVVQKIENYINGSNKLKMSFLENFKFLFFSFFCENDKINHFKTNHLLISESFDICAILGKLQQLDKIIKLLLSSDQLTIFNFFLKPEVILDDKNIKISLFDKNNFFSSCSLNHSDEIKRKNMIMEFINAWDNIKKKNLNDQDNKINEKLINFVGKYLKEIVDSKEEKESCDRLISPHKSKNIKTQDKISLEIASNNQEVKPKKSNNE